MDGDGYQIPENYTVTVTLPNQSKVDVLFKGGSTTKISSKELTGQDTVATAGVEDVCKGVLCGDGEKCNECTGDCDDILIDLAGTRPTETTETNTSGFDI